MYLLALLGLLQTQMTDFPTPAFVHSNKWNQNPFLFLKPEKVTPLPGLSSYRPL